MLTAQTLHNGELEETAIPRAAYKDVFTMEWLETRPRVGRNCLVEEGASIEDVKDILRNIIVGGELGLQRNTWEEFAKPTLTDRKTSRRFRLRRSKRNFKNPRPSFDEFAGSGRDISGVDQEEARSRKAGKLYFIGPVGICYLLLNILCSDVKGIL